MRSRRRTLLAGARAPLATAGPRRAPRVPHGTAALASCPQTFGLSDLREPALSCLSGGLVLQSTDLGGPLIDLWAAEDRTHSAHGLLAHVDRHRGGLRAGDACVAGEA